MFLLPPGKNPPTAETALEMIREWRQQRDADDEARRQVEDAARQQTQRTKVRQQENVNKGGRPKENAHIEAFIADKLDMKPRHLLPLCRKQFPDDNITKSRLRKILYIMRNSPSA